MSQTEYILGTDQEELARLERQHRLWLDSAQTAWDRAQLLKAPHILDLGCGPGFTSLSLLEAGSPRVTSLDLSESFLRHLKGQADLRFPGRLTTVQTALESFDLPSKKFEGAYSRWVLIFVQAYEDVIRRVREHLQPGSPWVLQEYVAYETMNLCPEVPIMKTVVEAIFRSWKDQGGDPNRGRDLPAALERNGFRVKWLQSESRVARPQDPLWAWPDDFYKNFVPKLVSLGYLTQDEAQEFFRAWVEIQKTPGGFFLAPTMMSLVAERAD